MYQLAEWEHKCYQGLGMPEIPVEHNFFFFKKKNNPNQKKLNTKSLPFGVFSFSGIVAVTWLSAHCNAQVTTDHPNWRACTQHCLPQVLDTLKGLLQAAEVHLGAFLQKRNKPENGKLGHSLPWSWLAFFPRSRFSCLGVLFRVVFFTVGSLVSYDFGVKTTPLGTKKPLTY